MSYRLPSKTFCLIRHGETTANRDGIIAGRLDVPLTENGRDQARRLRDLEWSAPCMLFASPMERALETCKLGFPDEQIHTHPDLRERDWGVFEGQPLANQPSRDGKPAEGEDWSEMIERVAQAITECCSQASDALPIMVCHSGVIRATRILCSFSGPWSRVQNAYPLQFTWTGPGHQESPYEQ